MLVGRTRRSRPTDWTFLSQTRSRHSTMTHRQPQDPIPGGGGFIPPSAAIGGLPSPAPSSTAASGASSLGLLPHPRSHSLLPGSDKEDMVRRYVEDRLLRASRRYVKKFAEPASEHNEEAKGYQTFGEVCRDLGGVIDVLWLSATRAYRPATLSSRQDVW